jgi:hypothetical protein
VNSVKLISCDTVELIESPDEELPQLVTVNLVTFSGLFI